MAFDREPPGARGEPGPAPGEPPPEGDYAPADPAAAHHELLDRIRALRTALAAVTLVALAALGVGVWALLADGDDETADRRGASPAQVRDLENRVENVESQLEDRATTESVSGLRSDQEELAERVQSLSEQTAGDELEQSVEQLSQDVQQLEQRVEDLEQQQQDGGNSP